MDRSCIESWHSQISDMSDVCFICAYIIIYICVCVGRHDETYMLVSGILAKLGLCLIFPILRADFGMREGSEKSIEVWAENKMRYPVVTVVLYVSLIVRKKHGVWAQTSGAAKTSLCDKKHRRSRSEWKDVEKRRNMGCNDGSKWLTNSYIIYICWLSILSVWCDIICLLMFIITFSDRGWWFKQLSVDFNKCSRHPGRQVLGTKMAGYESSGKGRRPGCYCEIA